MRTRTVTIVITLILLTAAAAFSQVTWDNEGGDGQWFTALNWSSNAVPGAGTNVLIQAGDVINIAFNATTNNLTMSGGTLNGGVNIDVNGSVDYSGGTRNITTRMVNSGAVTFTTSVAAGNVLIAGSGAIQISSSGSLGSLNFEAATTSTVYLESDLTVNGTVDIGGGTLDLQNQAAITSYTISVGGNWVNGAGTLDERTGTVTLTGVGVTTSADDFYVFRVAGGASVTMTAAVNTADDCDVDGTLILNNHTLNVANDLIGGGTLQASGSETIYVADDFTTSNFTAANSRVVLDTTESCSVNSHTFYDLEIAKGTGTVTATASWTVSHDLYLTSGTWAAGALTHYIANDWNDSGITFTPGSGTIRLDGGGATQTITQGGGNNFYNLIVNDDYDLASTIDVNGNLTINTGDSIDAQTFNIEAARNWSNNGTFTAGSGTVIFNTTNTGTISGSTAFNNFTCTTNGKTLYFTAGSTQSIGGTLTIDGGAGSQIRLLSTASGSQWNINPSANSTVSYVYVQDSNNSSANRDITANTSTDAGNNDLSTGGVWIFPAAAPLTWDGSASTAWDNENNWVQGYVPGEGNDVTIPAGSNFDPVMTAAKTVNNMTITTGTVDLVSYDLTVAGTLTMNNAAGRLRLHGAVGQTVSTGSTSFTSGTVEYYNAVTNTGLAAGSSYYNLEIAAGTRTLNANLTVNNNWTISAGSTLALVDYDVGGTAPSLTVNAGGLLRLHGGQSVGGTKTLNGPVEYYGTLDYSGSGLVVGYTYQSLSFTAAGTWDLASPLSVGGSLALTAAGTLDAAGNNITVTGNTSSAGTITLNGADLSTTNLTVSGSLDASGAETITVTGSIDFSDAGDNFTESGGSLIVMATGATPVAIDATGETALDDLTIGKALAADQVQLSSDLTVDGALTVTTGNLVLAANTLTLGSNLTMGSADGTITVGTGTLDGATNTVDISLTAGTITQSTGTLSCVNLTVTAGSYTLSAAGAINASGNATLTTGTFTESTSILTMTGAGATLQVTAPNVLYSLVVNSAGTVSILSDDLSLGGNLSVSAGTFDTNGTSLSVSGTATVAGTLDGSAAPDTITVTGNTSASGTINLNGGDFNGSGLTVSGTLVASGSETITLNGDLDFSAAGNNFTQSSSSVVMQGAATSLWAPEETFYDSSFTAAGTVTLQSAVTVGNDLSIGVGTTLNGNDFDIAVGRNWSNSGTYSDGPGTIATVSFIGTSAATISGNTIFHNFSCSAAGKILQFTAGTTQTINGSFAVTGAAGSANLVRLVSTAAAAWTLDNAGDAESVTFAYVQYGNVLSNDITADTSANAGNNDDTATPRWVFTPTTLTWTGAGADTSWDDGDNWDNGYPPNTGDDAVISSLGNQPATLATATTIANLTIDPGAAVSSNDLALTVPGAVSGAGTLSGTAGIPDELITVGGDFTVGTYTPNSTKVLLNGTTTPVSVSANNFYGLEIAKSLGTDTVNATGDLTFLAGGTLTVGTGNLVLGANTLTLGSNLALGSAAGTITVGAGTLDGATNGVDLSLTAGTITQSTGTTSGANLTVNGGTFTSSAAGAISLSGAVSVSLGTLTLNAATVGCVGLTQDGGTLNADTADVTSSGNVAVTAGIFNQGTSVLTMDTGGTTIQFTGPLAPYDLVIDAGAGTVAVSTEALNVANTLTVSTGTFNLAGHDCTTVSDTSVAGSLTLNGGALSTNNLSASGTVVPSGAETITVAGGIDFSDAGDNFTESGSSLIVMAGAATPVTINANGETALDDLTIGKAAAADQVQLSTDLTVDGTLTVGTGNLMLAANTLTVNTALDLASGSGTVHLDNAASALNLGANTLTVSAGTLQHDNGTVTAAGLTLPGAGTGTYDGTVAGVGVVTLTGALTISGGTFSLGDNRINCANFTQDGGTFEGDTGTITSSGNASITGGTHTFDTYTLVMIGNGSNILYSGGRHPYHLNIEASPGTVSINAASNDPFVIEGDLTIDDSTAGTARFTLVNRDLTVLGSVTVGQNDELAASGAEDISVGGSVDLSAAGDNYDEQNSTLIMSGATSPVTLNAPAAEESIYHLEIQKTTPAQIVNLASDITVTDTLTITSGTLAAGAWTINLQGGLWDNDGSKTGFGDFTPGSGSVIFTNAATTVLGSTTFWIFQCTTPGVTILFEAQQLQTINSQFNIQGASGNPVTLDSTAADPSPAPPNPYGYPPPPPAQPEQWQLQVTAAATLLYVDVQQCFADTFSITPDPTCNDLGWNYNWFFFIPIFDSWTIDWDNNGRIDRIRVQVQPGTQLSDIFNLSDLEVEVEGYTVIGFDTADDGAGNGDNDDVFDILLEESPYLDTDATPRWRLLANDQPVRIPLPPPTGLYGLIGGALVEYGTSYYTPDDGARPVIAYTLAVAGETKAYVHFSEPVYTDAAATAAIQAGDFTVTDNAPAGPGSIASLTPLETSGNGAHAAMIEFANPLSADDILLAAADTINALAAAVWDVPYTVDPATYTNTNEDGRLPPDGGDAMLSTITHRVSDVGLNIMEPVFAYDPTIQIDPVRGGIGRITRFDGSAWLQDRDILLQGRVLPAGAVAYDATVYFDDNPVDPILLDNLWIPEGVTTLVSNITQPTPPLNGLSGDTYHNANPLVNIGWNTVGGGTALRDFTISAAEPEMRDGVDLQFLFILDDAGQTLPCARIPDPEDPRTARPWVIKIRELRTQRGEASVTGNVINPLRGETVKVTYSIPRTGMLTINVFDLKGDIVDVLYRGQRTAGEYSTTWDGRNRGNRVVARGVYFIKIVGPEINEIRKVLVVK